VEVIARIAPLSSPGVTEGPSGRALNPRRYLAPGAVFPRFFGNLRWVTKAENLANKDRKYDGLVPPPPSVGSEAA
jgi:hypothetical protein